MTLEDLKEKLKRRLIESNSVLDAHQLADLTEEGRKLGLDDRELNKMLQEVDRSINWKEVKEQKKLADQAQQEANLVIARRKQEILHAPALLDTLILLSFESETVSSEEILTIFQRGDELEQNEFELSQKIKERLDTKGYRPHPAAKFQAPTLRAILESTNWYSPKTFPVGKAAEQPTVVAPTPVKTEAEKERPNLNVEMPKIHYFRANSSSLKMGASAVLTWKVTGVVKFTISHLGESKVLDGQFTVSPNIDTTYVLKAGDMQKEVTITVQKNQIGWAKWMLIGIVAIIFFNMMARC